MKCNQGFIKLFAIFIFASVAISLSMSGMDEAVIEYEPQTQPFSCFPTRTTITPPSAEVFNVIKTTQTASSPMAYLFQILFILFLISPPIIAIYLCLIWKELKKRNELK